MYFSFDRNERIADKLTSKRNFDNSIAMIDRGIANFYFQGQIISLFNLRWWAKTCTSQYSDKESNLIENSYNITLI